MQNVTITYNGLTLGDGSNYYITSFDPGELRIRQADQLASGKDGGYIFNQSYGFRDLMLSIQIFSGSESQFFEDIRNLRAAFARTNTSKELVINYWDGSQRRIDVFPTILPNPQHRSGMVDKSMVDIMLTAPWPFFKGATSEDISETLYLNESLGFDYPVDYPFDYEAGSTTNTYVFDNDGDTEALIRVDFNGPVINPTLNNTSTGEFIQIETTINSGTTVICQKPVSAGRSIADNSGISYEQYFNGETAFFYVPVGSNTFVFSASTYDSSASCVISITKYYLS